MSISSTIYVRFFANILASKNFNPKTQLCNFWRQNIGAKCAHKMLVKLTNRENNVEKNREKLRVTHFQLFGKCC